ncbi:MAG: DUF3035 domain-containing protein [Rhodospirillaceae bacterium]|nr:MAG: DUF3035 domain-containing protein [Rhodospirillaceae bacterium]
MVQTVSNRFSVVVLMIGTLLVGACDGAREAIGIGKQSPDEFAVVTRVPLSIPPDFSLRPPRPGADRPQEAAVTDSVRDLIIKTADPKASDRSVSTASPGESAILFKAGATNPDPNIRREINRESSILATENDSFADRLIFWQGQPAPGTIVDAKAETKRLRENAAIGDAPTKGRTPKIVRKPKGWLEGIFN